MANGEPVQELVPGGILDGREALGEPAFIGQESPVGCGQDVALHEQVAQVGGRAPVFLPLQALMGERDATGCQVLQEADHVGAAEPDQPALRTVQFQEEDHERRQTRVDLTGAVVEEAGEAVGQGAAFAEPLAEQHPLEAAAVAEEVATDPRTVAADRDTAQAEAAQGEGGGCGPGGDGEACSDGAAGGGGGLLVKRQCSCLALFRSRQPGVTWRDACVQKWATLRFWAVGQ
ncbi:hypothetical protein [Streptomyces sp. NPDC002133]|uniref:hypothetical protein n=1 Tax=Streptomyces sp. NPDC002133 TaxID=3154409 RepID=UPI0033326BB7